MEKVTAPGANDLKGITAKKQQQQQDSRNCVCVVPFLFSFLIARSWHGMAWREGVADASTRLDLVPSCLMMEDVA